MKERPILFSGPMVRAILDGRKTQTRRAMKPQYDGDRLLGPEWYEPAIEDRNGDIREGKPIFGAFAIDEDFDDFGVECPYGAPGDRLWVKETFSTWHHGCHWYDCTKAGRSKVSCSNCFYRSTHHFPDDDQKWVPSIFMPRWASRITLEINDVRVERLNDISEADAIAEGYDIENEIDEDPVPWFCWLWKKINGSESWAANPWVWVVEFRRLTDGT